MFLGSCLTCSRVFLAHGLDLVGYGLQSLLGRVEFGLKSEAPIIKTNSNINEALKF